MKKITLELTEDEYQSIIKFLEKIRNEEQKKRSGFAKSREQSA